MSVQDTYVAYWNGFRLFVGKPIIRTDEGVIVQYGQIEILENPDDIRELFDYEYDQLGLFNPRHENEWDAKHRKERFNWLR